MLKQIEPFTSFTGFTYSSPTVSAHLINEYADYVSGNTLTQSLIFKFDGASGQYFEKTFSPAIDVSDYSEIVMSIHSRNYNGAGISYKKPADFKYKIDFGTGKEFYLPIPMSFSDITIALGSITSIERIRVTALSNDRDYVFFSNMLAIKDELPLDLFTAIQERLEKEIADVYPDGYSVGTIASASTGDDSIDIDGNRYFLGKYSLIKIKDGSGSECVHLGENDEYSYKMLPTVNNGVLVNNYTSATVYLQFPVVYGTFQDDIILPSISVWGFAPEPVLRGSKLQVIPDTYKTDGSLTERRDAQIQLYRIFLAVESRQNQLNGIICQFVRNFIAREELYMNGRKYEIKSEAPPIETEPVEPINDTYKHVYEMVVEVKEEIGARVTLPNTTTITGTVNIQE